jgi:hypothetical protein
LQPEHCYARSPVAYSRRSPRGKRVKRSVSIRGDLADALQALSEATDRSQSSLVEDALRCLFAKYKRAMLKLELVEPVEDLLED